MLAKPFIFFLTFILTMANFIFLLIPICIVLFPIFLIFKDFFINSAYDLIFLIMALISFLTVFYMFVDMLFGYTARKINNNAEKFILKTAVPCHEDILNNFERLKNKFNVKNVDLYLLVADKSVNAYAIGGARRQSVTLTMGLIFEVYEKCNNEDNYVKAITAIMGHELSHLINKDFLPGLIVASNETAIRHVSKIIRYILLIYANIFRFIPFVGWVIPLVINKIFNVITKLTHLFYNWIFTPLYNFFKKWFGRSIEYRCDKQAAYAVGGRSMVLGLEALGAGSYFSIFSTHPRTKHRINYVKNILPKSGKIRSSVFNSLANFVSMSLVVVVMYVTFFNVDIASIQHNYNYDIKQPVVEKYYDIQQKISWLYGSIINDY